MRRAANDRLRTAVRMALGVAAVLSSAPTLAAEKVRTPAVTGTIKDLESREIQVERDPPSDIKPSQAAEQYQRFLELQAGDAQMRAEAMRRLGDLRLEADENRASAETTLSGPELQEAIKLYEGLLATYPNNAAQRQGAVPVVARVRSEFAARKSTAWYSTNSSSNFPASAWNTEAQFRRGELLFSAARYREAEVAYAAVIAGGPDSGFYEQGLYKHGWSLFKQGRGEDSVESFLKVIDSVLVTRWQATRSAIRCSGPNAS